MKLNIKATKTTLTPSITEYIEGKIDSLENFLKPEHKVRVELEVDKKHKSGELFRVEIEIMPNGFYADARSDSFHRAMDLALPKIKEQLVKEKDKKLAKRKSAARSVAKLKKWAV